VPERGQQREPPRLGNYVGVIDPDAVALFPPAASSKSENPPSASFPSPNPLAVAIEHGFRPAPWASMAQELPTPSKDRQPQPKFTTGSSARASVDMPSRNISNWPHTDSSMEERLSNVADQAKLVGFEDLEAVFAAYHSSLCGGRSQSVKSSA
jgi:hypothetical protein